MRMTVEQTNTPDAVEYKVILEGFPKPLIVDASEWPKFVVEWMGKRMEGVYLGPGSYIINGVPYRRDDD